MDAELSLSRAAIDALADDIAETAAHFDAATHRLLVLIRDFDRARGWHQQGALSCAQWLSWRIGLGLGPAREKVRIAHRLASAETNAPGWDGEAVDYDSCVAALMS